MTVQQTLEQVCNWTPKETKEAFCDFIEHDEHHQLSIDVLQHCALNYTDLIEQIISEDQQYPFFDGSNLVNFNLEEENEELASEDAYQVYDENPFRAHNKASQSDLDRILVATESNEPCGICFDQSETSVKTNKCGHIFCRTCISQWLTTSQISCPSCRRKDLF